EVHTAIEGRVKLALGIVTPQTRDLLETPAGAERDGAQREAGHVQPRLAQTCVIHPNDVPREIECETGASMGNRPNMYNDIYALCIGDTIPSNHRPAQQPSTEHIPLRLTISTDVRHRSMCRRVLHQLRWSAGRPAGHPSRGDDNDVRFERDIAVLSVLLTQQLVPGRHRGGIVV